ncbi:MAG: trypsin-like peptidase domain-containing protein [Caldilineaceae bacterium]
MAKSVVSIDVLADASNVQFGNPFGLPGGETPQIGGQGSGWIYDSAGHIVTNNHVVENANEITVRFFNGYWADAEVVATDPEADLAVIKVTPPDGMEWQPLPLANPDDIRVGHMVIALGNPFGLDSTMTTGIVSALGRSQPAGESRYTLPDIIQTDAAINPGNSGGPLINLKGEVVGVNFAIQSQVRSNSGVGFTIPVSIVQRIVPALIENGGYNYPYLGISGQSINPTVAKAHDMQNTQLGVYVAEVIRGGPSDEAGIVGSEDNGDIVIAIDDQPVGGFEDLVGYLVTETAPGQTVTLTVLRDGEQLQLPVTLGERPNSRQLVNSRSSGSGQSGPVNARQAIELAEQAVVDGNLVEGDIIQRIVTPGESNGVEVWEVELTTDTQTAHVTVERETGEILQVVVE